MMKINRVKDLPDWFDLNKYAGSESFCAAEWLEQLTRRQELIVGPPDYVPGIPKGMKGNKGEKWIWRINSTDKAKEVWQLPLLSSNKKDCETSNSNWLKLPIRPVRLIDLAVQKDIDSRANLDGKASIHMVNRWKIFDRNNKSVKEFLFQSTPPLILTGYSSTKLESHLISVDLNTPDPMLVDAFKVWLKNARAQQPETSKCNRPAYKNWTRYGLLPYLDLLIWAEVTRSQIPRRVYSAAVSSNDYDMGDSAFSKTVVPLAMSLMEDLSEIRALAKSEALSDISPEEFIYKDFPEEFKS